jgi:hypothetical protein
MNQHRIARLIACFASVGFLALPACLLAQREWRLLHSRSYSIGEDSQHRYSFRGKEVEKNIRGE